MKKTICLMTNWYPTEENPYRGVFFREQAFAVGERFNFLVVHCTEKVGFLPGKKVTVRKIREEQNITEYEIRASLSRWLILYDELYSMLARLRGIDPEARRTSERKKKHTRNMLVRAWEQLPKEIDAFYCVDAQIEAYPVQIAAEMLGKPYVIGEHAPVPWLGSVLSDTNRQAIEKADLFLAISQDKIRQLLLQNLRLPKTVYIGNLIDETQLTIVPKPEGHVPTLLIVAAHSFFKNYGLFIRVMNRLTEITDVAFRVMIVGYASNKGYSSGAEEFEEEIRQSAFAEKAEMIREVAHENIAEVYRKADVFVMTSIQEGQPVSAMEAACCGLPVYSTRCGGVEDYVDGQMGRIYAVDDCEGMARGLKEYLEGMVTYDPEYIRDQVVRQFGREAFAKTFTDAFSGVMENA